MDIDRQSSGVNLTPAISPGMVCLPGDIWHDWEFAPMAGPIDTNVAGSGHDGARVQAGRAFRLGEAT
jgi:hypothetical protein